MTDIDTPVIRAGAIQFIRCDFCDEEPGRSCRVVHARPASRLPDFAHVARRMKYVELRDVLGEPFMVSIEDML